MADILEHTVSKAISPIRALFEGVLVSATVPLSLSFLAIMGGLIGVTSPALPPLGVFLSVILAGVFLGRSGISWRDVGFCLPDNLLKSVMIGVAGAILSYILYGYLVAFLLQLGLPPLNIAPLQSVLEGNFSVYVQFMIFVVWGSAAFGEELFARGFLLARMEIVFARVPLAWLWAAIAQALVFGAFHFYQGITGAISLAVVGFIMALMFFASGRNLFAPILAHGLIDTYSVTQIYLGNAVLQ